MRSYHVDSGAGIDGLALREHENPVPGPDRSWSRYVPLP